MARVVQVVAVGRLRPPLAEAGYDYEARVARLVTLRVDEVAAEAGRRRPAEAMRREAARVRDRITSGAYRVALTADGAAPASSRAFATWLTRRLDGGRPTSFVIGGAHGLDPTLVGEAEERLALGPLTMPHQLARVVLAEQLYRALLTLSGDHPYPR